MSFRNYPRNEHAIFAAMGHFFGMNQLDSRQVIAEAAKTHWSKVCPEDTSCSKLPPFVKAALEEGKGWERELIMAFASEIVSDPAYVPRGRYPGFWTRTEDRQDPQVSSRRTRWTP